MKTFLIIMSCVLIHSNSLSQIIRSYGIKAGLVSATQTWDLPIPSSQKFPIKDRQGIDAGIFVEWLKMPILSILTEAHYIQKGFKEEAGDFLISKPSVDYISVPVMAKARLSDPPFDESPFSLYVIAGPRVDLIIHTNDDGNYFYFDKFNKVDYGATIGAGLEFSYIGYFRIGLELQYSPNFTDAYSRNAITIRNNSWEMLLTVGM